MGRQGCRLGVEDYIREEEFELEEVEEVVLFEEGVGKLQEEEFELEGVEEDGLFEEGVGKL